MPPAPLLELRIIGIRPCLLQEMTHAPAHTIPIADIDAPVRLAVRFRQHIGNGATQTGLLDDIQYHGVNDTAGERKVARSAVIILSLHGVSGDRGGAFKAPDMYFGEIVLVT